MKGHIKGLYFSCTVRWYHKAMWIQARNYHCDMNYPSKTVLYHTLEGHRITFWYAIFRFKRGVLGGYRGIFASVWCKNGTNTDISTSRSGNIISRGNKQRVCSVDTILLVFWTEQVSICRYQKVLGLCRVRVHILGPQTLPLFDPPKNHYASRNHVLHVWIRIWACS